MLRPWLQTARPADWRGTVAWSVAALTTTMFLLVAIVGRLPQVWIDAVWGFSMPLRAGLALFVLWMGRAAALLAYALIPGTPVVVWGQLRFRSRGKHVRLRRREIVDVWVERRPDPAGETIVVESRGGRRYDLCPLAWAGAGRVYQRLARWVAR